MSFAESYIIPKYLFLKCRFDELMKKDTENTILQDTHIEPETKMKLYQQEKFLKTKTSKAEEQSVLPNIANIIQHFEQKKQPFARSILEFILKHPDEISWDENNYTVNISGEVIANSNILEILRALLNKGIITSEKDVPVGLYPFYFKLIDLGLPESWITAKFKTRFTPRRKISVKRTLRSPKKRNPKSARLEPPSITEETQSGTPLQDTAVDTVETQTGKGLYQNWLCY